MYDATGNDPEGPADANRVNKRAAWQARAERDVNAEDLFEAFFGANGLGGFGGGGSPFFVASGGNMGGGGGMRMRHGFGAPPRFAVPPQQQQQRRREEREVQGGADPSQLFGFRFIVFALLVLLPGLGGGRGEPTQHRREFSLSHEGGYSEGLRTQSGSGIVDNLPYWVTPEMSRRIKNGNVARPTLERAVEKEVITVMQARCADEGQALHGATESRDRATQWGNDLGRKKWEAEIARIEAGGACRAFERMWAQKYKASGGTIREAPYPFL